MRRESARSAAIVALITAVAGLLRVWGLGYGLPHPTARPDEELVIGKAFAMFSASRVDPGNYTYPSLVMDLQALAIAVWARIGALLGWYHGVQGFFYAVAVSRPSLLYTICRGVSVALSLTTVVATYHLAWAACRRRDVGWLAALVVATNYLHVRDSRFGTVDVGMTLFVALSLVFALRAAERQVLSDYAWAGAFAGLAASAKYNGGIVALAAIAAALVGPRNGHAMGRTATKIAVVGLALFSAFAVTSPYVLLRLPLVLAELSARRRYLYEGTGEWALWVHLRETLPVGFGWPLFVVVVVALIRAVRWRRPSDLVLLVFLVPMLASTVATSRVYPRYLVPFVPVFAYLGAELTSSTLGRRTYVWLVSALVLVAPGLWRSVAFDRLAAREDTRVVAAEWVTANVPPRSRIAVCMGYAAPVINTDFRRPPAFRVSMIDCQADASPGVARYLVTTDHPRLGRWSPISKPMRQWLASRAHSLVTLSPFREGATDTPYFYPNDAFYIPFSGLGAMERGGPIVTVWDLGALVPP